MQHQGIHYDTGTMFRGPGYAISTRRTALDMSVVRRELEINRDDLHANAVRIVGSHVGRMTAVAEVALGLGIEVWFSPAFFEYSLEETAARVPPPRPLRPFGVKSGIEVWFSPVFFAGGDP